MTGKTHVAIGIATALGVSVATGIGNSVQDAGVIVVTASMGSLFPDLDLQRSMGSKIVSKVFAALALLGTVGIVMQTFGFINLGKLYHSNKLLLVAWLVYMATAIYGKTRPHREFTHSLLAMGITSISIWCAAGIVPAIAHGTAFASHLLIDLLNNKGESLLWPAESKFCLKVCSADGAVNRACFYLGSFVSAILLVVKAGGILK